MGKRKWLVIGGSVALALVAIVALVASAGAISRVAGRLAGGRTKPPSAGAELNHAYVALDAPTVEALSASPVVRRLGVFEERTTRAGSGDTWTGKYLYFETTYLEILAPGDGGQRRTGEAGIGLSVDEISRLALIAENTEDWVGHSWERATRTKLEDGREIPWFDMLYDSSPGASRSSLKTWVMAYRPEWFVAQGIAHPASGRLTRRDNLAVHDAARGGALCTDIVGIRLVLTERDWRRLRDDVTAFGWSEGGTPKHRFLTPWSGSRMRFTVDVSSDAGLRPLAAVTLACNAAPDGQTEFRIGASVLRFEPDGTAVWTF